MILLIIPFSPFLLWAACGFSGLPAKAQATAQVAFPAVLLLALSSIFVVRVVAQ
ncbi:MAG: hypothetical protein V4607_10310 [Pseudomonadota bacterium]